MVEKDEKNLNELDKDVLDETEELSLESMIEQQENGKISNILPDDDISLEKMSLINSDGDIQSENKDVQEYKLKNHNNKRREHLTAREDYLDRKNEERKARRKRVLFNGSFFLFITAGTLLGIYTAFPEQINYVQENALGIVTSNIRELYNDDIKMKVRNDFRKVLGKEAEQKVVANLQKTNIADLTAKGIEFVTIGLQDLTAKDFDKGLAEGNYLVGKDIPAGYYKVSNAEFAMYTDTKKFENPKNKDFKKIDGDVYIQFYSGEYLIVKQSKTFIPVSLLETEYVSLDSLESERMYLIGKEIEAGTYVFKPVKNTGYVTNVSKEGLSKDSKISKETEMELKESDFISIKGLRIVKK